MGPTMILGATRTPLDHSFILRIFKEFFEYVFQKTLEIFKFLKILLRCILKKSQNSLVEVKFNLGKIISHYYNNIFALQYAHVHNFCLDYKHT
jgi:hypothetical protein